MHIKYIEIENILSIQQVKLEFGDVGLVLLDGWNYDDDTANGAGKTAILNSISYALYGKFPRKISASDILRTNTKSGFVKVGVEVHGSLYEVYRARPNCVKYYIDGLEKDITQEEFESFIRIGYSQYLISMYSAQTEGLKLISLNDSGKKDFFLQLMNLNSFEDCREEINKQLNDFYTTENQLSQVSASLGAKIETYRESIIDIPPDIITHHDEIRIKIALYALVDKPDTSKIDLLEQQLNQEFARLHGLEVENSNNATRIKNLRKKLDVYKNTHSEQIECPHCNESFCAENELLKNETANIQAELSQLESNLVSSTEYDDQKHTVNSTIHKCKEKRRSILDTYLSNQIQVRELEKQLQYAEQQVKHRQDCINRNTELEDKIVKCTVQLSNAENKLNILRQDIELHESMLAIFGPTGAPAYILDSAVDVFNDKVAHYTSLIWPNASYALQSFKENKNGEVKAKFSEKFTINGKERSIGALSGGEHRCLSLAVDFAVIDVLETMFGMSLNPIMLDEPYEGLDTSNRERVFDLLDKMGVDRQVWIVDHDNQSKAMFSNTVRVEKRSGISAVV